MGQVSLLQVVIELLQELFDYHTLDRGWFGFTRKMHCGYYCGFTPCHVYSSKKAINTSLAPNGSVPHRVCNSYFSQLRNITSAEAGQEMPNPKQYLLMYRSSISNLKLPSQKQHLRHQRYSPRVCVGEGRVSEALGHKPPVMFTCGDYCSEEPLLKDMS